jgi:hypothetical protein
MKVTFIERERCFVFHDLNVDPEHKNIFNHLNRALMQHELLKGYHARVLRIEASCFTVDHPVEGRKALYTGPTVELVFDKPEGAMAFKLAFMQGETYLPWTSQG